MNDFAILSTTAASANEARALGRALVEARLAACVQILPITSIYRWEGAVEEANEHLLLCKIAYADFEAVETEIRKRHSYDVPEMVVTPIAEGHPPYMRWLRESLRR